jgi:NAD(P)-dependent dehydrogenase (short-subunit alcohol dehydrogenase family)
VRGDAGESSGRVGVLDDLIGATVFFCSYAARYVTGQLLYIDGGYMSSISSRLRRKAPVAGFSSRRGRPPGLAQTA